jgi:hypothetical protein
MKKYLRLCFVCDYRNVNGNNYENLLTNCTVVTARNYNKFVKRFLWFAD